jgi:hypothetical protein
MIDETKLSEPEWQRITGVVTWHDFLQLPFELQQKFRHSLPGVAEQLERKHFAKVSPVSPAVSG